jgi:hypothetical protein
MHEVSRSNHIPLEPRSDLFDHFATIGVIY